MTREAIRGHHSMKDWLWAIALRFSRAVGTMLAWRSCYWICLILLCCPLWFGCQSQSEGVALGKNLALGNPSAATHSTGSADNYLISRPQYVLSYNRGLGRLNWASWELNQSWLGEVDRQNDFRPDLDLPKGWYAVTPHDYTDSGYDRGHMVPSGDRTHQVRDNSATFLMTNILPQAPDNNQGPWVDLEEYCRILANKGKELYIIAGGEGRQRAIAKGRVVPPKTVWKIIVVLDQPGGLEAITINTRVIAVQIPNVDGIRDRPWREYRVSVDQLEEVTGYDFLSRLPDTVETVLEQKIEGSSRS
jgi:endonuclease G, mitochondrial